MHRPSDDDRATDADDREPASGAGDAGTAGGDETASRDATDTAWPRPAHPELRDAGAAGNAAWRGATTADEPALLRLGPQPGLVILCGIFVIAFAIGTWRAVPDDVPLAILLGAMAAGNAIGVLMGWNARFTLYPDRIDWVSWRRRRRVVPLSEVTDVRIRPGLHGAPKMTLRVGGQRFGWNANRRNNRGTSEPIIRILAAALADAGVPVDSRNREGTGPYDSWVHDPFSSKSFQVADDPDPEDAPSWSKR